MIWLTEMSMATNIDGLEICGGYAMKRDLRVAFTLVELLVVIAIIGVLVAMLLAAVQAAREAGRRAQCSSNLRQIGIALANYEDTFKRLPPGAIWEPSNNINRGSVLVHILPFVEQSQLFQAFDFRALDTDDEVFPGTSTLIASTPVNVYRCPSDDGPEFYYGNIAVHTYAASRGPTDVYTNASCPCPNPWQALSMAPLDDPVNFAGPFTRVGTTIRSADVHDGLSNTIFFGEVRPRCSQHAQNGWANTNDGNGYCSTLIPINYDTCQPNSPDTCHQSCNWTTEVGFKSAHPNGAQFLLGDGSAHFINDTIDHVVYQALGAKNDGRATPATY